MEVEEIFAETSIDGKTSEKRVGSSRPMIVYEDECMKKYRHELRSMSGTIMIGSRTIGTDNPLLTVRYAKGKSFFALVRAFAPTYPLIRAF